MNKGQKELFLAKLHSLPKFNSRTTFPDFKPRDYSAQETADFVAEMKSNNSTFTKKDLSMIGKNDQFLEDLLYSGRAEQVEGTRSYKIKDNFEFDIARRAEGFNETPQEFGARLTAQASENKLTPEGIAELVAAEETRQEKLLPPVEVIPKTINYAESLEQGKTSKFAQEIRKTMDARGLKETGIVISDDILSTTTLVDVDGKIKFDPSEVRATETEGAVEGEYDKNTDTIFLSLNAVNPDGSATDIEIQQRLNKVLDHEMIHALRAKDLISAAEYSYLTKMAKKTKFPKTNETFYARAIRINKKTLEGRNVTDAFAEQFYTEEAIAELFRNKDLLVNTPKKVEGIFNKIIEFFKSMGQAMRTSGYKSATEIFNDIESGKIGSRTRDEIRTTRLGDKERTMFLDRIPQDKPVPPRTEVPGEEIVSTLKPRGIRPLTIPKPKPTPPTTPTTPVTPATPTTIYNRTKLTDKEYKAERDIILKGLQDAKVLDKDIFDKDGNVTKTVKGNYDSVKMMKWLVDNSPSQDYKIIAQKVHKSLLALKKQKRTFPLQLVVGKKVTNSRALGQVSPNKPTDIIEILNFAEFTMFINDGNKNINKDISKWRRGNGVNFETLLHEGIHQATLAQIYAVRENTTTRVADSGTMAIATDKKGLKVKAAYKELSTQAKRIQKYYRDRMRFYDKLSYKIETPEGLKEYNAIYNNAPVIEKEIADIYINTDSTGFKFRRSEGFGYGMEFGQTELRQAFNQYRITYQLFSNEVQANEDVSELLTFGLTNREFQEMLEYIPLGKNATGSVWNKFVETIRKLLEIPAKLNTELSSFLKNASTALDLKAEGIKAPFVPASEREVSQDIPTFSRESDDAYFAREKKNQRISNLESIIYSKEAQLSQERGSMTDATARRLEREIGQHKNEITELRAGDLPTFSRASTETEPAYMDLTRADINEATSFDEYRNIQGEKIPNAFVMRMPIDAYLKLTTPNQDSINKIKDEVIKGYPKGYQFGKFDPSKVDDQRYPIFLNINALGKVTSHEGRHRAALLQLEDAQTIPVIIRLKEPPIFNDKPMSSIKNISDLGISTLDNQFKGTRLEEDYIKNNLIVDDYIYSLANEDVAMVRRFVKEDIDNALKVANAPDVKIDMPLFSRANLIPKDNEVPFNATSNIRFETSRIIDQLEMSREPGGNRDNPAPLKMAIVEAFKGIQNRPLARASKKFLEKFTNNKGNLVLFRALNIPEGENIKNYGQLPEDVFASTTLDSKKALEIGRNLFNRAQRQGAIWNPEILRYEVPMSKVKGYVPMLLKAMESDYIDMLEDSYNGAAIFSQDDLDILIEEAEEQGDYYKYQGEKSKEEYFEDDMYQYNEYMEEAEVLADLRGIKPTYQYSPKTSDRDASLLKDVPLFSRGQRFNDGTNSQKNIKLADALAEAEETVKQTPRGAIPFYNLNASDMALEVAIEFNKDLSATTPEDIPTFSRPGYDGIDSDIAEASERLGGKYQPDRSWGARTIEAVKDPVTSINSFFKDFRQNFIDKLDKVDKKIMQASQDSEEVRYFNNTADTATMAALRLADRARGLFQGMLTRGYVSDVIDGNAALANVKDLELQNGETGGLIQILAPLFSNPEVNLEKVFKLYATLKRAESFDAQGKLVETPVKAEDYVLIQRIEQQHPEVLEVYNNYQTWNNKLIDFAEKKGLLDPEQAELWRTHSSYYPFYRNMVDDAGISAPTIAGGSLPNNPLAIKIEGSEDIIDVDPIEAISRNSLSILTAALKNDGTAKLLRDLQSIGEARPVTPKQSSKLNTIFVFENGNKQFYEVDDINLFHGIQGIGGVNTGTITKILAFPAGILRDTVTRDPGFVVINILRDTLSSAVTSGAPYTPVVDSVKNMFRDMENLEKFGVLGGYDFSNDEGSVKQFITRTMRQKGLTPENGMSASSAFFKVWDGLGALTTKSDGATRLAVYEGVYKKLKEEGYTEAQAQSEAAFQALEIINFGRRGLDPMFKVITAAIPFLNARVQGLDVLYRGLTGQYSSVEKLQEGETLQDVQSRILRRAALNAGLLVSLTLLYYMMVSDSDEYKNLKREVRDDNWVMPIGDGHAVKIPIPFEVGMLFKAIPERVFDMTLGEDAFTRKSVDEALTTTTRQLQTSLNIPFFQPGGGLQLLKPIAEVYNNKNTFTNTEIVPYYQQKKEAGLQSRATTNELAKVMGEFFNISPSKIEHVMRGYTGTLGGYVLTAIDTITRGATGSPLLPSNFQLSKMPVFNRLLLDLDKSGGYQQQFYELRNEVDKAVQTINSLKKQQRFDELSAYRSNMQGVLNVKGQVRAIDRYLSNWRERRDRLMRNENISLTVKSDMLRDLELERDMRLAMIPELRKKANIPVITMNL